MFLTLLLFTIRCLRLKFTTFSISQLFFYEQNANRFVITILHAHKRRMCKKDLLQRTSLWKDHAKLSIIQYKV